MVVDRNIFPETTKSADVMLSYFGKPCHALCVKYQAKKDKR